MNRRTIAVRHAPLLLAGALAATVLAGCGEGDTGAQAGEKESGAVAECQAVAPEGTFEYTDARGKTVELDEIPATVVAQSSVAAALWDAGYQVDGIFGELGDDPAAVYQRGNVDLAEVTSLGNTWGEFDVDSYGRMDPDLLLDFAFSGALWYVPSKQEKQIEKLAPIVGVNGEPTSIDEAIDVFVDLAARLGVDTDCSKALTDAQQDYDAALAEITANEKDLQVLIASGSDSSFWVVNPTSLPETNSLTAAGVDLIAPENAKDGEIFTELSWEQAADYAEADVILVDARNTEEVRKKMETIDTWANLPAVKAGQVYSWYAGAAYSYQAYADIWAELADNLAKSEALD